MRKADMNMFFEACDLLKIPPNGASESKIYRDLDQLKADGYHLTQALKCAKGNGEIYKSCKWYILEK